MDRVLRALSVGIILFAVVIALIVGSRIDQNTVSLLSGAFIGVLIASPCTVVVTLITMRRRETTSSSTYDRTLHHSYQMPPNPPQYWILPQPFQSATHMGYQAPSIAAATSAAGWPGSSSDSQYLPKSRRFYMIGTNGEPKAVEDETADEADSYNAEATGAVF